MLVTRQALDDAAASAKVVFFLAVLGFFAGAMLTATGSYLALPESARNAIPPEAVMKHQLSRIPGVLPETTAMRPLIAKQSPTLSAAFDAMPFNSLLGGLAGALMLPFGIAYLKTINLDRRADAGRRNSIPRR